MPSVCGVDERFCDQSQLAVIVLDAFYSLQCSISDCVAEVMFVVGCFIRHSVIPNP